MTDKIQKHKGAGAGNRPRVIRQQGHTSWPPTDVTSVESQSNLRPGGILKHPDTARPQRLNCKVAVHLSISIKGGKG
jgi:hypothetical protein